MNDDHDEQRFMQDEIIYSTKTMLSHRRADILQCFHAARHIDELTLRASLECAHPEPSLYSASSFWQSPA